MKYDIYELPFSPPTPGKNFFLLGQAKDGPINSPVFVKTENEAKAIFKEGNLLDAYKQIAPIQGVTVYLMRVTGEYARSSLIGDISDELVPAVTFRSVYGGEVYNNITLQIKEDENPVLEVVYPKGAGKKVYQLSKYQNINDLLYEVNRDARLNDGMMYAYSQYAFHDISILYGNNTELISFAGGADGLNHTKDELYEALDRSYSILEGREIDIICPYPARFDDTHPIFYYNDASKSYYQLASYNRGNSLTLVNPDFPERFLSFHEQLIDFCRSQERFGFMTHGVIGLNEVSKPGKMQDYYISRLLRYTAFADRYGLVEKQAGIWFDKGFYISVFAQDFVFYPNTDKEQTANGCALYGALIASLRPDETTTNLKLPSHVELQFELSPQEIKDLSFLGAVTARTSVSKGLVIANGITAGLSNSAFHLLVNIRMIQYALHALNQVLEDMVGEPWIPVVTLREMDERVRGTLDHLQGLRIIKGFEYRINYDRFTQAAAISLNLLSRYSVEQISASTTVVFDQDKGAAQ